MYDYCIFLNHFLFIHSIHLLLTQLWGIKGSLCQNILFEAHTCVCRWGWIHEVSNLNVIGQITLVYLVAWCYFCKVNVTSLLKLNKWNFNSVTVQRAVE